jgi:hypothetical protein
VTVTAKCNKQTDRYSGGIVWVWQLSVIHRHTHIHTHTRIYTHTHTHSHTHRHTHEHTNTQAHMHTHTHTQQYFIIQLIGNKFRSVDHQAIFTQNLKQVTGLISIYTLISMYFAFCYTSCLAPHVSQQLSNCLQWSWSQRRFNRVHSPRHVKFLNEVFLHRSKLPILLTSSV